MNLKKYVLRPFLLFFVLSITNPLYASGVTNSKKVKVSIKLNR
jgi:hypothetical protein